MTLQTLLILSATLLLCSDARLPRQLSLEDKMKRLPDLNTCGLSEVYLRHLLPGLNFARLKELPWMAALGYVSNNKRDVKWLCGGSLITNQHVLTAAYCVQPETFVNRNTKLTTIRLGELDLNETINDGSQPQDIAVDSFIVHEEYNRQTQTNVIAIIKMKTKVTFTSFIRPICLPPQEFLTKDFTGYLPSFAGWGRTSVDEPVGTRLMQGDVEIRDIDECRRKLTSKFNKVIIDSRVMCASFPGVDACQGFGGGPLMLPKKQEQVDKVNYFLMGIISYGYKCAAKGYPGVYTNVASYSTWIIEHLDI